MANRFGFSNSTQHDDWLDLVGEDALEPELPIIDAHHHLWVRDGVPYLLQELSADIATGHNVVATVFAECHSMYRAAGPEHMQAVGESEFVSGIAAMSDSGGFGPAQACKVMFGAVDMTLGLEIEPVLEAHMDASGGRFRGVRVSACWHGSDALHRVVDDPEYLRQAAVRDAIGVLASKGLSMDCWVYHTQLDQLTEIAVAFPDLRIVANHCGTPILGGPFRGKEAEVFEDWQAKTTALAEHPNVYMKAGALPIRKQDRSDPEKPPSSDEVAAAWRPWIEHLIAKFGSGRCMFESNFPVHKNWVSYPVLWNAFKRLAENYSADEKADLFFNAANNAYRIGL